MSDGLVMEYLFHEQYRNTANAFLKSISKFEHKYVKTDYHEGPIYWNWVEQRQHVSNAIKQGNIEMALHIIRNHFPLLAMHESISPSHPSFIPHLRSVLFQLKCQHFIEIIRCVTPSSFAEALSYAQAHLRPASDEDRIYLDQVTPLIAYEDPYQSPSSHLLTQDARDQLAIYVNHVLMVLRNMPLTSGVERILMQIDVVKDQLRMEATNDMLSFSEEYELSE
ncbi:CTLH/CRA C-terminal to lish motif domain-containing protein [Cokeromyces recurvatus]|uniref:CTLH/CRA C-terminal to lish motif domain-containing protein n=1 Tax=Cokeromyces recurvatus TaxID=90255 RepID=UPI00221EA694|nr:CTLH/CRA C-terminal to lish motif domain-containing protein [Cokeromyces recurvatus]KAI7902691.1 CTLH/CRA C-terminal to lish motif domain-containing protein [Cokeromyces recurvatus]